MTVARSTRGSKLTRLYPERAETPTLPWSIDGMTWGRAFTTQRGGCAVTPRIAGSRAMDSNLTIDGDVTQAEQPDWAPLADAIGYDLAGYFMWMFEVRLGDGTRLHAYKHIATRRYLHLATDGRAFRYRAPRGYAHADLADEIVDTFEDAEHLMPCLSPEQRPMLDEAVGAAREGRAPSLRRTPGE